MSGQFLVTYAGLFVRFNHERNQFVDLHDGAEGASVFEDEASAWLAAHQSGLAPKHTAVKPLSSARCTGGDRAARGPYQDFISAPGAQALHRSEENNLKGK